MFEFIPCMFSKLFLDRIARDAGRANSVELIAQDTHDLGGDGVIEQSNRISDVPLVIPC